MAAHTARSATPSRRPGLVVLRWGALGAVGLSLILALLVLVPGALAGTAAGCAPVSVASENARAGGTGWRTPAADISPLVQGYASATSAMCGQRISLSLGTRAPRPVPVRLQAWRLGDYRARGGRLVWTSGVIMVRRPAHWVLNAAFTHMISAPWRVTTTLVVPRTWTQGVYVLRIVPVHAPASPGIIPLVVRDPVRTTALVDVLAVNTWQMYNDWGGWSAYSVPRSRLVSFNRPYAGPGWGNLLSDEYPLIRFAERSGLNIGYATDVDLSTGGARFMRAKALLFGAHSEYWTTAMRVHLQQGFAAGVNAVFFGGNNMFWRPAPVGTQHPYRQLAMYRLASLDPYANNPALASEMWRDPIINQPEQTTLGEQYGCDEVLMPMSVPSPGVGWMFAGTGAQPGQILPGVNYYETDYPNPGVGVPPGTQLVTEQTFACPHRGLAQSGAAVTLVPGAGAHGGLIVDVGTEGWVCNLTDSCQIRPQFLTGEWLIPGAPITPGVDVNDPVVESIIQQATRNILGLVGQGPAGAMASAQPYPLLTP